MRRDDDAAHEVFAEFSEAFWIALPSFEWRCSLRTFAYKLARRTAAHYRERSHRRERFQLPAELSKLSLAVERVRTARLGKRFQLAKERLHALMLQAGLLDS